MDLLDEAIERFSSKWEVVKASDEVPEPTAVVLSTADATGRPSSRVVLLKEIDRSGFVFYTNYRSRKGRELAENPWAALCFYWFTLAEQVRVEGGVERVSPETSDSYWETRARESQLGAWASQQSSPVTRDSELAQRFEAFRDRFEGKPVPRPEHWGGFRLSPQRLEFWNAGAHRLHDRVVYERGPEGWARYQLFP